MEQWKENEFKEPTVEEEAKERAKLNGKNRIYDNRFEMIPYRRKGAAQAERGDSNAFFSEGPNGVSVVVDRKFVDL